MVFAREIDENELLLEKELEELRGITVAVHIESSAKLVNHTDQHYTFAVAIIADAL